jgi:hypothetical protein
VQLELGQRRGRPDLLRDELLRVPVQEQQLHPRRGRDAHIELQHASERRGVHVRPRRNRRIDALRMRDMALFREIDDRLRVLLLWVRLVAGRRHRSGLVRQEPDVEHELPVLLLSQLFRLQVRNRFADRGHGVHAERDGLHDGAGRRRFGLFLRRGAMGSATIGELELRRRLQWRELHR